MSEVTENSVAEVVVKKGVKEYLNSPILKKALTAGVVTFLATLVKELQPNT